MLRYNVLIIRYAYRGQRDLQNTTFDHKNGEWFISQFKLHTFQAIFLVTLCDNV